LGQLTTASRTYRTDAPSACIVQWITFRQLFHRRSATQVCDSAISKDAGLAVLPTVFARTAESFLEGDEAFSNLMQVDRSVCVHKSRDGSGRGGLSRNVRPETIGTLPNGTSLKQ
jgi:hypothetical protein